MHVPLYIYNIYSLVAGDVVGCFKQLTVLKSLEHPHKEKKFEVGLESNIHSYWRAIVTLRLDVDHSTALSLTHQNSGCT